MAALVVLAGTLVAAAAALPQLANLTRDAGFVSPDDPYVRLDREITEEFGMENPLVWVLEARQGSVWAAAMLGRIRDMTREILTIPGVIAPDLVSLASPNLRDVRMTDDGFEQVYLMGEVPETSEAISALRQRIDGDPNFRGVLVSTDGRAAMVVANFRTDADPATVARAALVVRDRYTDAQAAVYVTGAPVLQALALPAARPLIPWVAASAIAGLLVGLLALGARTIGAAVCAAAVACIWAFAGMTAAGLVVLPWTAYALPPTALIAAAVGRTGNSRSCTRGEWSLAAGLVAGFTALALFMGPPARAFGLAGAAGVMTAVAAGLLVRVLFGLDRTTAGGAVPDPALASTSVPAWYRRPALALLIVVAVLGIQRLQVSLGLRGYGERYLPPAAVKDLDAVVRLFPPPTALTLRLQGQPGLATAPGVLNAMDALAGSARTDAAVRSAMSLADLVKMVNRAFNENRSDFFTIPQDQSTVSRYLTLAYSPGFRRFVDRALATTTVWVYLDSERPRDIARVLSQLQAQLAARPVPDAQVDLVGGDGAVILAMARVARRFAIGGAVLLLAVALVVGGFDGRGALLRCALGSAGATAMMAATFGWVAVPIDLVSLPFLVNAAIAGAVFGVLGAGVQGGWLWRLALVLAAAGVAALSAPAAGLKVIGTLLLAPATGAALSGALVPPDNGR